MLEEWSYLPPAINNLLPLVWCHTVYFHYLESLALCLVQVMETALKKATSCVCFAAAETAQRSAVRVWKCSHGEYPPVMTALLPLRLFTSSDVCKQHGAVLSSVETQVNPHSHSLTSYCILSAGFFRTKVTGKKSGVSYTNWAQISAWRKQHEVTEHRRVPRIVLTHTWRPLFFFFFLFNKH